MNTKCLKALLLIFCLVLGPFLTSKALVQNSSILDKSEASVFEIEFNSPRLSAIDHTGHSHPKIEISHEDIPNQSASWTGLNKISRETIKQYKGPRDDLASLSVAPQGYLPSTRQIDGLPFHLEKTFLRAQLLSSIPHPPTQLT